MSEQIFSSILSFVPIDARGYVHWLLTGLIILVILNKILKQLQTPQMQNAWSVAKSIGGTLKNFAQEFSKRLELPAQYPFLELLGNFLFTASCYLSALYFFALFAVIAVLTVIQNNLTSWQRLGGTAFAAIAIILVRFYFAEAERGRIAIPVLYRNLRSPQKP